MEQRDRIGSIGTAIGLGLISAGILTLVFACCWQPDYYTRGDRYWTPPFTSFEYYALGTLLTSVGIAAFSYGLQRLRMSQGQAALRGRIPQLVFVAALFAAVAAGGLWTVNSAASPTVGDRALALREAEDVAVRFLANTPTPSADASALITVDYRDRLSFSAGALKQYYFATFRVDSRELDETRERATFTGTLDAIAFNSIYHDKRGAMSDGGRYEKPKRIPFHLRLLRIQSGNGVTVWRVDGADFKESE